MRLLRAAAVPLCAGLLACAATPRAPDAAAGAGIDSLDARLADAYRRRDPAAYAALWTDSARFEWPATPTVRGPAALGAMARDFWAGERDVELRVAPSARRVGDGQASELGAFQQTWTDTAGVRRTEFGRYAALLVRRPDGAWRLDRWMGFEDSTRTAVTAAPRTPGP